MTPSTHSRLNHTRWLITHTRQLLPPLTGSVAAAVLGRLAAIALLVTAAGALAAVGTEHPMALPTVAAWLVGLALAKALLSYLEHFLGHWVAFTALQRLRELFFDRLIPQAPAATAGRAGAELTLRGTRDIDRIEVFFAHTLPPAVAAVAVPAITLWWIASRVDAALALALAPFTLALLAAPFLSARASFAEARRVAEGRANLAVQLGDNLQGVREIVAFGIERTRLAELDAADSALAASRARAGRGRGARAAAAVALQLGSLLSLLLVASGTGVDAGLTAVALAAAVGLWGPGRGVDDFIEGLDAAFASTARVREVVDARPMVVDRAADAAPADSPRQSATLAPITPPALELSGVTFRYPGAQRPTLESVSLTAPAGEWIRICGVSGSGKSTIASLIVRGWDPEAGTVRLDGRDVRDLTLDTLRGRVAVVSQRPVLVSGSLAENLRLSAPEAGDDAVREAIHLAAIDEWIGQLPDGLATEVANRGFDISGGQLQRLALARALVARPEVLILDEALSQLDRATAHTITRRLENGPPMTIIEITHRADLVPDDAPVHVIDAGRLRESGAAGRLREAGGAFTQLEARV